MPTGNVLSRKVLPRLLSERAVVFYLSSAAAGLSLVVISHFTPVAWPFWLGLILLLPLVVWLMALLCLALPVLVVLRGFSTRRDDGNLPDE